ncbi:putative motility protein [Thiomicrorhabdus sp. 6S3-12]|uniref:putative motility protein n=1 Tax=Thiomicrorhabdus sp. 6S3-12 TaxID=2819681 RepID=UPI001AAC5F3F|nr:YjfB family protein [Thiomicrorhabdus sp. 6S3-12]MBO1923106.1 putative motility protein [Thiomicrorhabdus sp. 6S3-12]
MAISTDGSVNALQMQPAYGQQQAQVGMLKKSIDLQSQAAMMLINSIPQVSQVSSNPTPQGNLGQNIDVKA